MQNLDFLNQPSYIAARQLIGHRLYKKTPSGELVGGTIIETEAYDQTDKASHCYGGKPTPRTAPMFSSAGHIYVYFTYGIHHCCNIVTSKKGHGAGVLIRALLPDKGQETMQSRRGSTDLSSGPAKLCQALDITLADRNKKINSSDIILLPPVLEITSTKSTERIGIKKDTHRLWRFVLERPETVSSSIPPSSRIGWQACVPPVTGSIIGSSK